MVKNNFPYINSNTVLVFDKDGVLFHSEDFKFEYFLNLFKEYNQQEEIRTYLVSSGGTPRKVRFQHIFNQILKLRDQEEVIEEMARESSRYIDREINNMPFVEGAMKFIEKYSDHKLFVCSGSTQDEVDMHLTNKGLSKYFLKAYGGVTDKSVVLKDIKQKYGNDILFFGDTMVDYHAALKAEVSFVGFRTSRYHDPFRDLPVSKVSNFLPLI